VRRTLALSLRSGCEADAAAAAAARRECAGDGGDDDDDGRCARPPLQPTNYHIQLISSFGD